MGEAAASGSSPLIPQPGGTAEELREALARIAPETLETFDAERAAALAAARQQVDAAPVRRFLGQWAVNVAIARHPDRAARLRELEARAETVEDLTEARTIAAEVGRIQDAACLDAGVGRGPDAE